MMLLYDSKYDGVHAHSNNIISQPPCMPHRSSAQDCAQCKLLNTSRNPRASPRAHLSRDQESKIQWAHVTRTINTLLRRVHMSKSVQRFGRLPGTTTNFATVIYIYKDLCSKECFL